MDMMDEECSRKVLTNKSSRGRLSHMCAVNVLASIHQRKQRTQDARLNFIRHRKAARRDMHQRLSAPGNFSYKFDLAFVTGIPVSRLAAHFRAFLLDK
jgi:hypothetical protein